MSVRISSVTLNAKDAPPGWRVDKHVHENGKDVLARFQIDSGWHVWGVGTKMRYKRIG